ncbi:hypothetical protein SCP_0604620 [Sparassis crispa]|uniref:Uncharacterized protein n=1 Tax=Sparassis crispa TaxID=139825 RepID=A0A401GQI1_9APHY|nr:hypothetical protein SCP_0604620 [Sparassis crispa]GBE84483.1 hypothetical protein SCP_0604620 [Sparassis crispa]
MTAIDGFTKSLVAKLDPEWTIKVESFCNILIVQSVLIAAHKVMVIDPGSFYTDCTERSMPNLKLPGDETKAAGVI